MAAMRKASWEPVGIKPPLDATEGHCKGEPEEDGGFGVPGAVQCDVLTSGSRWEFILHILSLPLM